MGIYAFILAGGNYLSPVLAGFINDGQGQFNPGYVIYLLPQPSTNLDIPWFPHEFLTSLTVLHTGWAWVMYWCAIWLAMGFVFCFFFLEETNYDRVHDSAQSPSSSPGTSTPQSPESRQKGDISEPEKALAPVEKATPGDVGSGVVQYKMKTYTQRLSLRDKPRPFHLWTMMYRPLLFVSLPAVTYAGFSYGSNLVWFNVLNGTASPILGRAPYNFPASMVGLTYVSPIIG